MALMEAMLRALSNPTRRRILAMVWRKELPAGEIAAHFDMARPAVSQHLGVLLKTGLIKLRRRGTRRLYQANRSSVAKLCAELGSMWDEGLGRLKRAAEAAQASGKGR